MAAIEQKKNRVRRTPQKKKKKQLYAFKIFNMKWLSKHNVDKSKASATGSKPTAQPLSFSWKYVIVQQQSTTRNRKELRFFLNRNKTLQSQFFNYDL